MSYWLVLDEGLKHYDKLNDKDLDKEAQEKQEQTIPKEKLIICPKCKTLNQPNSVLCISCGENMVALKQAKIKNYDFLHKARKRRKH